MTYEELDSMLTMHLGAKPWIAACEFLYVESERQDKLREELAAEIQEANKKLKSRKRPANTDSQQKEIDRLKHIIQRREEQLSDALSSVSNENADKENAKIIIEELKRKLRISEESRTFNEKEVLLLGEALRLRDSQLKAAIEMHETIQSKIQEAIKDTLGIDTRKQPLIQNVKHLCNRLKQAEATLPAESELQKEITAMREQFFKINAICESAGFSTFTESYADQVQAVVDAYLAKKGTAE